MATLDSLPADQRAVLQLVLQRGRSYDEIARLLSIDRAAVRERALNAFDALGPQTGVPDQRRALLTDYLLGQLPSAVAVEVHDRLAESPSERAWARVLASELAPLTSIPLPEIPTESSGAQASPAPIEIPPLPADAAAQEPVSAPVDPAGAAAGVGGPAAPADPVGGRKSGLLRRRGKATAPAEEVSGERSVRDRVLAADQAAPPSEPASPGSGGDRAGGPPRSSRRGGILLLSVGIIVIAAVVIVLLNSGGANPSKQASGSQSSSTPATSGSASASSTATTSASTSAAKVVAQINLTPTVAGSKSAGIAEVLKEGSTDGVAIVAQNMAANTTKPPNAYAVWLYNSPADAIRLGFVNPGVGSTGRLSTAGGLPTNASHYKQLIVTLETTAKPTKPGTIVLQGTLTGL